MLSQACPSKVKYPHGHSSNAQSQASREKSTKRYQNTIGTYFAETFSEYIDVIGFFAHTVVSLKFVIYFWRFEQENAMASTSL